MKNVRIILCGLIAAAVAIAQTGASQTSYRRNNTGSLSNVQAALDGIPVFTGIPLTGNAATATAYGDSITGNGAGGCFGASPIADCYANLIATQNHWTVTNDAIPGEQLADFFPRIYTTPTTQNGNSFMLFGYNDMRFNGGNSAGATSYTRELYSALAWMAIPTAGKITGQGAGVTLTGSWSNTVVYGGALGINSATNGSTASFQLYGPTLYIDIIQFAGSTRGMNVAIDGVDHGTYNGSTFLPPGITAVQYAPYLIRIPNLTDGPHDVVLTITNGTGNAYFNWAGSASGSLSTTAPTVYLGNTLPMNAIGYTLGAPFNNGNNGVVTTYNSINLNAARDLAQDGLNVAYVDAASNYNVNTMVAADNIHPNNAGHQAIANAFFFAMNSLFRPRTRGLPIINWQSTSANLQTSGTVTANALVANGAAITGNIAASAVNVSAVTAGALITALGGGSQTQALAITAQSTGHGWEVVEDATTGLFSIQDENGVKAFQLIPTSHAVATVPLATAFVGTSGGASCSQSFQGTLKISSCYLNAYANTGAAQTYTFTTAFSTTPVLQISGGSCGTYNPTSTSTVLTLPANAGMIAETCNVVLIGQ